MEREGPLSVHVTCQNGVAWIALRGELDMSVAHLVTEALETIEGEGDGVSTTVFDLRDLTFVDSSGLHSILGPWRRAQENGHQLRVVGVSQSARRVFEITRTEFLLDEKEVVSTLDRFTDGPSRRAQNAIGGVRHA